MNNHHQYPQTLIKKIHKKKILSSRLLIKTLICSSLFITGCGSDKTPDEIIQLVKSPLLPYMGNWQQQGTGVVLQLNDEKLLSYHINSYGCVKTTDAPLAQSEGLADYLSMADNVLTLTNNATNDWTYQRITDLPSSCYENNLLSSNDAVTNFEFLWHSFNDYYAFLTLHSIDWQALYDLYRPTISSETTQEQLVEVFDAMLSEIDDAHISLTDNESFSIEGGDIKGLAIGAFRLVANHDELDTDIDIEQKFYEIFNILRKESEALVKANLLDNKLHDYQGANAINWGLLPGNTGYLRIERVSGMLATEDDSPDELNQLLAYAEQDLHNTDTVMQAAMADLEATDALVIDLRINEGGFDKISQRIASYFSDQQRTFAQKQIKNNAHTGPSLSLQLTASPITPYVKPIIVITGQSNVSGGEVLAQALKSLPNVTVIGQPTSGSVSDALDFTLPNGWQGTLSHQVYTDNRQNMLENYGVQPETELPTYSIYDLQMVSDTPLDHALQQLNVQPANISSFDEVATELNSAVEQLGIPGISVAVINKNNIVWQSGFGLANIETNSAVTEHTPFNVGSISKAVMATAISQQIEKGNITLDTPLSSMNLPFVVDNPNSDAPILLKHLVTHTSGINDTIGYGCSYYIHETGESLYHAYGVEGCPAQVTTDPSQFYQEYFTTGGKYYSSEVFSSGENAKPGAHHNYSNVAAGLAGYAIEQALNIDFAQTMKEQLFEPLGMQNTHWFYQQLDSSNPKAVQYSLDGDNQPVAVPEYSYPTFYDGDLNTSAHDLARLLISISQGGVIDSSRILTSQTVNRMLSPQPEINASLFVKQGLFWYWEGAFFGHTGGDPGTIAFMQYNPSTQAGFVVLMNGEDESIGNDQISEEIMPLISKVYRAALAKSDQ